VSVLLFRCTIALLYATVLYGTQTPFVRTSLSRAAYALPSVCPTVSYVVFMCLYLLRLLSVCTVPSIRLFRITRRIRRQDARDVFVCRLHTTAMVSIIIDRILFLCTSSFACSFWCVWSCCILLAFVVGTDSVPCSYVHATTNILQK